MTTGGRVWRWRAAGGGLAVAGCGGRTARGWQWWATGARRGRVGGWLWRAGSGRRPARGGTGSAAGFGGLFGLGFRAFRGSESFFEHSKAAKNPVWWFYLPSTAQKCLTAFLCTKIRSPQPAARCSIRPPPLADDGSLKALNFPAAVKVKKSYME